MSVCTPCTVVNLCKFQHPSSHADCNFDARFVSKSGRIHEKNSDNSMYKHNLGPEKQASALSVIIAHSWALKVVASFGASQFTKFRVAFVIALHLALVLFCNCCHDPFIVRSAQTCPQFTGFTQFAHPSRCSRSTLTTVCFCIRCSSSSPRGSVFTLGLQPFTRSIIGFVRLHLSILQTCNVVVAQKQRLASFQHLRSSSLWAPS